MKKEQRTDHLDALKSTLMDMANTAHMLAEKLNKNAGCPLQEDEKQLVKVAKMQIADKLFREMKMMYLAGYDDWHDSLIDIKDILEHLTIDR